MINLVLFITGHKRDLTSVEINREIVYLTQTEKL